MLRRLSSILFLIIIVILLSPPNSYAAQQKNDSSFFLFFKQDILVYATNAADTRHVFAAQISQIPPTPLPTQQPTIAPTQIPVQTQPTPQQSSQVSDVSAYLLNGVNQYRASLGLSPVQSSAQTCAFAATRAQEIASGFNHNGFNDRVSNHTIPYSSWTHATENIAQAPNYQEVVTLWKNSPEHAANMRDNTPYVCVEQYGSFYAYEGMRP